MESLDLNKNQLLIDIYLLNALLYKYLNDVILFVQLFVFKIK